MPMAGLTAVQPLGTGFGAAITPTGPLSNAFILVKTWSSGDPNELVPEVLYATVRCVLQAPSVVLAPLRRDLGQQEGVGLTGS